MAVIRPARTPVLVLCAASIALAAGCVINLGDGEWVSHANARIKVKLDPELADRVAAAETAPVRIGTWKGSGDWSSFEDDEAIEFTIVHGGSTHQRCV